MNCDMCGKNENLLRTSLEGSILNLCKECSRYGKVLGHVKTKEEITSENERIKALFEKKTRKDEFETNEAIVSNFGEIIRKKRESMGLNQEGLARKLNEKESVLHQLEQGKLTPSIELARKIEKHLNLQLVYEVKEEKKSLKFEGGALTIGDMLRSNKR